MEIALAKSPGDRFGSARELIDAAANVLGVAQPTAMDLLPAQEPPAPTRSPTAAEPARSTGRRLRLAAVALPLAAAVATGATWPATPAGASQVHGEARGAIAASGCGC